MSGHLIIQISGKMGSGKTTLGKAIEKVLLRHQSIAVVQLTYATELYRMHDFCLGVLKDAGVQNLPKKDGNLLQLLGTEWGRQNVSEDVWVILLKRQIQKFVEMKNWAKKTVFVISDCRFRNEFDAFPDALTIRLVADRETRKIRCESWRERDNHPSETDLDEYSFQKKFKMYFETSKAENTPEHMAELIAHQILTK